MNKTKLTKELVLQGKTVKEISKEINSSPNYVYTMMNRLRKDKNFNIKFSSKTGRAKGILPTLILDVFYKFSEIHGFAPTAAWVARRVDCSREYARRSFPLTKGVGDTTIIPKAVVPNSFYKFAEEYSIIFDITRAEAMQSILGNMDWSVIDLKKIQDEILEKSLNEEKLQNS